MGSFSVHAQRRNSVWLINLLINCYACGLCCCGALTMRRLSIRFLIKTGVVVLMVIWVGMFAYMWSRGAKRDNHRRRADLPWDRKGKGLAEDGQPQSGGADTVHVVISSDRHTVGGMIALINSIVSNTRSPVFFHLITDLGTGQHIKTWLWTKLWTVAFEVKEFPVDWVEGKIKVRGGRAELANPFNYARFFLPDLFPRLSGRVVYIDDDCIVQGDISELFHISFHPGTVAAFSEDCHGANKEIAAKQNRYQDFFDVNNAHLRELALDPKACAFNTGVFVTNLTEWRTGKITQQLMHWLELNAKEALYGNEKGGGGSQPPMMLTFYKKYTPIDPLWHLHFLGQNPAPLYTEQEIAAAKLLHWNGRLKPWKGDAAHQHAWDRYYVSDPTGQFKAAREEQENLMALQYR